MSLYITKFNDASTNISYQYLDTEHVWGINVSATYSFLIYNVNFTDGQDNITSGIDALKKAYLQRNISAKIGTDEFDNGLVTSINFNESDHTRFSEGSITIEETKRVDDDAVLSELFYNIPSPQDVEGFSEEFNFSRGANNYSYNRSISLKYKQDASDEFLNKAKLAIKSIYLGSRPSYGFQGDGISEYGRFNLNLKPLVEESYNLFSKEMTFKESFESARIETESGITFSKSSTYNQSLNSQGYTTKKYSVEIKALAEPLELNVSSGIELSLQALIDENTGTFGIPISIEKGLNSDGGMGSLSVDFTNDPRQNSLNSITYSVSKSNQSEFDEYTFDLDIRSKGFNREIAFENARSYFSGNRNLAYEKIDILFPNSDTGVIYEVSRNVNFNPFEKNIKETVRFSEDPSYNYTGDPLFKGQITVNDTLQVNRDSVVPIYGSSEIITRYANGQKLGQRTVSFDMVTNDLDTSINTGFLIASGEVPNANYFYLKSKSSVKEPLLNKSSVELNFDYFD